MKFSRRLYIWTNCNCESLRIYQTVVVFSYSEAMGPVGAGDKGASQHEHLGCMEDFTLKTSGV
jgi:hypothetical protein